MKKHCFLALLLSGVVCVSFAPLGYLTASAVSEGLDQIESIEETLVPYVYSDSHEFTFESVIVVLKHSYSELNKKWNESDFNMSSISSINDLTYMDMTVDEQNDYLSKVEFHQILRLYLREESAQGVLNAIEELEKNEMVLAVEPNFTFEECSTVPNDPYIPSGYYGFSNPDFYSAWDIETGSSTVKVGIIDSGIANVADLANNVDYAMGYDFYNDNTTTDDDSTGHGTNVASVVGAIGNNGVGVCGTCWHVSLIPLQVIGGGVAEWIEAITYAETNNIPILNLSYTVNGTQTALSNELKNYNGLFVCSAGNNGIDMDNSTAYQPACLTNENIISVAASKADDNLASFSNYGAVSVDLAAPGSSVWVTTKNGTYTTASGTSFASPMVAGAAALLLSYNSNLTSLEIKEALLNSVDHITSYEGKILSEGRLNIANALNYVKTQNQVQNIVVRVSRASSSPTMTSLGFYITYFKNYQSFAGIVNGSALPSGTSMSYYQTVTNTTQRVLQAYYSGPAITNTGTLFTCRFKTNVNESYSVFADTIYVSNPYNLPYTIAVLGDLNNDGFVDNTDKETVLKYIAGLTSLTNQQLLAADVDFSGSVDVSDAIEIAKYAAGTINSFY